MTCLRSSFWSAPMFLLFAAAVGGCAPFPVHNRQIISYTRDAHSAGYDPPGSPETLEIEWLGTACQSIRLGGASILTDPFVSYHGVSRVLLGTVRSQPRLVDARLGALRKPGAMFVGHSHYDHMLDLHAARTRLGWDEVPVVGSETTRNLLASFPNGSPPTFHVPQAGSDWTTIAPGVAFRAFAAEHAPQATNLLLYPGFVTTPLTEPPKHAGDYRCGDTYAYLFHLRSGSADFTVYFAGSASTPPLGFPPPDVESVDVLILCVPGWKNVRGYPAELIRRLKPRQIVLSHFDNFLQEGRWPKWVIPTADLDGFIREALSTCTHPRFERLCIPDVGATVRVARSP